MADIPFDINKLECILRDMKRSRRTDHQWHATRDIRPDRPVHVTAHVAPGVPRLRTSAFRALFKPLLVAVQERGVRVAAAVIMDTHLHLVLVPPSKAALGAALRIFFGQLARRCNALWRRRGSVWNDRFWSSSSMRSAREAWNTLGYVLRNPQSARLPSRDENVIVGWKTLGVDQFLRSVFGPTPAARTAAIELIWQRPVDYIPIVERLQPLLPGLFR